MDSYSAGLIFLVLNLFQLCFMKLYLFHPCFWRIFSCDIEFWVHMIIFVCILTLMILLRCLIITIVSHENSTIFHIIGLLYAVLSLFVPLRLLSLVLHNLTIYLCYTGFFFFFCMSVYRTWGLLSFFRYVNCFSSDFGKT